MKKLLIKLPAAIVSVLLVCACSEKPVKETVVRPAPVPADRYNSMDCIDPLTGITGLKNSGKTSAQSFRIELHGIVEVNGAGDVYIVINPRSKSRETYLVTGAKKRAVAVFKGRRINVKCCLLEKKRWSGTIRVYEILN
ncbi:MAG TPA: hypothetical protein PK986_12010 [Spirochaetota bacterium]|nr:hypothetical protein [Spirochaetota bacterium]HQO41187.1 hypothetical protein [Spirochaetota bacterium]